MDGEHVALGGREQRLCALLALTGTRPRAQVAGTLWPESTDARALASLRRAVAQTHQRCPDLLSADRTSIGLAGDVDVDVVGLRAAVSAAGSPEDDPRLVADLVRDELLPGWYDEWVADEREELERQRVGALERLARRALDAGATTLAEDAARAVAKVEPLRESASELVIRALLARDDRGGAVRELERYRQVVHDELGVVPSPALFALVAPAPEPVLVPAAAALAPVARAATTPVAVPAQRTRPVMEDIEPEAAPEPAPEPAPQVLTQVPGPVRPAAPPVPPPPPDPLPLIEPTASPWRAAAARLAVGAALVMAASFALAYLGPDREVDRPAPAAADAPDGVGEDADPGAAVREVLVRPVAAADGVAAFLVRATQRPARVRVEVESASGDNVVRSVVVRDRVGQKLVLDGLDAGTYQWSATSPTAAPVTGQVRVAEHETPSLAAAGEPSQHPTPTTPSPSTSSTPSTPSDTTPTEAPTSTPTQTPSQTPTQQSTPTQQPTPNQPSPTRQPSAPSQPTDPGTQDPGPVG